jgi:hypothetical protein
MAFAISDGAALPRRVGGVPGRVTGIARVVGRASPAGRSHGHAARFSRDEEKRFAARQRGDVGLR